MKKMLILFSLLLTSLYADDTFTGSWCLEEQGMVITFINKEEVKFSSTEDDGVQGSGSYTVANDIITANIANSDMEMVIKYKYKKNSKGLSVTTVKIVMNGETVEHSTEVMQLVRCKPPVKKTVTQPAKKSTTTKQVKK